MSNEQATDAPGHEAPESAADQQAATNHGDAPGHDDHDHPDEALGPIDVAAWGAGILGVGVSVVIAACFVLATSGIG